MYTVGHEASYDVALAKAPVEKIGERPPGTFDEFPDGYPGGWVFTDMMGAIGAAVEHEGYAVYELGGTFTASRRYDGQLHLNNDTPITGKALSMPRPSLVGGMRLVPAHLE